MTTAKLLVTRSLGVGQILAYVSRQYLQGLVHIQYTCGMVQHVTQSPMLRKPHPGVTTDAAASLIFHPSYRLASCTSPIPHVVSLLRCRLLLIAKHPLLLSHH